MNLLPDANRKMSKTNYKESLKKFGKPLSELRKKKNLSLRDLSYACDIDNSKISKIEKGMVNITFTTMVQLAEALEVSLPELMQFDSK